MKLNEHIDHTLLGPAVSAASIEKCCLEALEWDCHAVCVPPIWVKYASELLSEGVVQLATVVGFPHGNNSSEGKLHEALLAVSDGASELDLVCQLGWLIEGRFKEAELEIETIRKALDGSAMLKVIVESGMLSTEQIASASKMVMNAGADMIKTSTGFNGSGASLEAVQVMKETVGDQIQIKASGGIRDRHSAITYIEAGADRLGCSATRNILFGN